ncbi:MAG: hypothetical protein ACMG55_06010 [Microcoleus sp.]
MKRILTYSLGIAGLAVAGLIATPSFANAQSVGNGAHNSNGNGAGHRQQLQTKADLLKMTKDELTTQLKTKTMLQIAEDKGISADKFHESMETAAKQRWSDRGLTQAEIDSRLKNMAERQAGDHEANSADRGNSMGHGSFNQ